MIDLAVSYPGGVSAAGHFADRLGAAVERKGAPLCIGLDPDPELMPEGVELLPLAQTIWYIPTGLDIWNQKIAKAPGHYARGFQMPSVPRTK